MKEGDSRGGWMGLWLSGCGWIHPRAPESGRQGSVNTRSSTARFGAIRGRSLAHARGSVRNRERERAARGEGTVSYGHGTRRLHAGDPSSADPELAHR